MQQLTRAVVATFVFLLACSSAFAQEYLPLRGLTAVKVDVGKPDEDAQACGVTDSLLNAAASKAFSDAKIEVADSASATASIKVTTVRFKTMDQCVSSIRVELVAYGRGVPPYGSRTVPLTYLLASGFGMQSQPKAQHGEAVTSLVKTLVEDIATRIRLANQ